MAFLARWEADALNSTCSIVTGSVYNTTTTTSVACRQVPPTDEQDDVTCDFLVKDTTGVLELGARIVHSSTTYLVKRLSIDGLPTTGNYVRAACQVWPESLT